MKTIRINVFVVVLSLALVFPAAMVQAKGDEALVLQGGQLPPHVEAPECLVLAQRELERRALEVVHEDERVVRVDARMLGRRAEQVVGMRDHELVERRAGGHEDRRRGAGAAAGAGLAGA